MCLIIRLGLRRLEPTGDCVSWVPVGETNPLVQIGMCTDPTAFLTMRVGRIRGHLERGASPGGRKQSGLGLLFQAQQLALARGTILL